jgi:chromosome segregation ATPase
LYVFLTTDPTPDPTDRTNELIDELRDRVRSLEDQLKEEREANRENRRIIAALTSRIPELEAPSQQPRESPVRAADEQDRGGEPRSTTPGTQEPYLSRPQEPRLRSWWRRWLTR